MEVRLPLPIGTKRNQLDIKLRDDASGANLWRTEIETAGGRVRGVERAILRVCPAFWPEPLIEGVLRGAIDPGNSTYQLSATAGGDAWDALLVTLAKAAEAEGWWGGVVEGDAHEEETYVSSTGGLGDDDGDEELLRNDAARLVQRMATAVDDGALQLRCARACATLADAGRSAELLAAKAHAQLSMAMRRHTTLAELQAAGCAVFARAPVGPTASTASVDAVLASDLLGACVAALLRHTTSALVQLHGSRALLRASSGNERCASALLRAEGAALLGAMLQQPAPTCDAACAALAFFARMGQKGQQALVVQGAAPALLMVAASEHTGIELRRRCAHVVFALAQCPDIALVRSLLGAGLLPTLVSLCNSSTADEHMRVLAAHAIGALSWRGSSAAETTRAPPPRPACGPRAHQPPPPPTCSP